jgi:hypothetical protein
MNSIASLFQKSSGNKPPKPKVGAPPVYRPLQNGERAAQAKSASNLFKETRPAPPVYRPETAVKILQPKPAPFRVETRPAPPAYRVTAASKYPAQPKAAYPNNATAPLQPAIKPAGSPKGALRYADRATATRVVQRSSSSEQKELDWTHVLPMIKRLKGDGSPTHTKNTLPGDIKDELETQAAIMGSSPPKGDYEVGKTLSGGELEHATEVSEAYTEITKIIVGLLNAGDDEAFNALSQSGFLKRFVNIEPTVCNQRTSQELLICLAMIPKRKK